MALLYLLYCSYFIVLTQIIITDIPRQKQEQDCLLVNAIVAAQGIQMELAGRVIKCDDINHT